VNDLFENDSVLNLDNGHYISLSAIENFFDIQSLSSTLLEQKKEENHFFDFSGSDKKTKKKALSAIITKSGDLILVSLRPYTLAARIKTLNDNHYSNLQKIFNPNDD